jgi:hypothetical protein
MATPPQHDQDLPSHRGTESYGLGQSGYTAGRREHDPALERDIEVRNRGYPRGSDEHVLEHGDDERWIGRGGSRWYPETEHDTDERDADAHDAGEQNAELVQAREKPSA